MKYGRQRRSSTLNLSRPQVRRGGVVLLEFIVATPIFVILLFAVVEFGLMLSNLEQVKQASRAGAMVAAELSNANLSSANPANNITLVNDEVTKVLSSAGMAPCEVLLDYNPTCSGIVPGTKTAGVCPNCHSPAAALPNAATIPGGTVRVTVCVDVNELTPDMLATVGFSVSGRTAKVTTLLPYENCK